MRWARVEFQAAPTGVSPEWQFLQAALGLACEDSTIEALDAAMTKAIQARPGTPHRRGRQAFWRIGKDVELMTRHGRFDNPLDEGKTESVVLVEVAIPQGEAD